MKLPRRKFLHLATSAALAPAISHIARAQTSPTRPVRLILGYGAGGAPDIVARVISRWLSEQLRQPLVIENRSGASSNIGTEAVVRAGPDGYTLLYVTTANATNATLFNNLNFDFIRDIAPVAGLNFGAVGGTVQLAGELFNMVAGTNIVRVPYRNQAQAVADLISGQMQVGFDVMPASISYVRAGQLRALAVTTTMRSDALPDTPAVAEFISGYEASIWHGIGAPKGTPRDIIEKINSETNAALADSQLKARLADLGGAPMPMTPTEFGKLIAEETVKWGEVIRAANIKPEDAG